jgi:hypothetical protein
MHRSHSGGISPSRVSVRLCVASQRLWGTEPQSIVRIDVTLDTVVVVHIAERQQLQLPVAGWHQPLLKGVAMRPFMLATFSVAVGGVLVAGCGGSTTTILKSRPASSPTPDSAASVLYKALSAAGSNVSSEPTSLTNYASGVCNSLGKIALVSEQAGQDAYRLGISDYEQEGYTEIQARAVMNAIIYGYCPQWDSLTNTAAAGG